MEGVKVKMKCTSFWPWSPPWLQVKVTKYFDFVDYFCWRVVVCVRFSSVTTQPISPMMIPINWGNNVDVQRALHFDLHPLHDCRSRSQNTSILWIIFLLPVSKNNLQNRSISWPWPAVMEGIKVKMKCTLHIYIVPSVDWYHHWRNRSSSFGGEANTNYYPSAKIIHKIEVFCDLDLQSWRGWRSKWSARCTSTLFPQLIGIIIGEIGWVVTEEKRTQTTTRQQK